MMQKFRKLSLESQLFFSFMAVSVCLLLLSLSITLFSTITRQRQEIDKNISALAAYVASMDNVVSMLENGYPDGSANEELDSLSENFPDLNVMAIYNTTGLRFYHTNRKETGETFVDGEEEAILKGSQPYITIGYGTNGSQRRAFHSIRNSDGAIIGFVIASVFNTYISEQVHEVFPTYLLAAMIMLLVPEELTTGLAGMDLLQKVMSYYMGEFGVVFIAVTLALFSFSTFLGILFYARSNVAYLFGNRWIYQTLYKIFALIMLFAGGLQAYTVVWDLGDVGVGLMTVFNLIVLFPLSGEALRALKEYEEKKTNK